MGIRVGVVGGGAAGFFAAIACAEASRDVAVTILEKGAGHLAKVLVSGGGRCNVTHACFDPRELAAHYPRGARELIGPFRKFQPRDTMEWFARRGVDLKTEADGRVFPVSDTAQTITDCLLRAAAAAGVRTRTRAGVERAERHASGGFEVTLSGGDRFAFDRLLLATGGCRNAAGCRLAAALGHAIEPPVPSLFSFHLAPSWLRALAGVSVESAEVSVPGMRLRERGALLVTHQGLSGPAVLRLSAWGARPLYDCGYRFPLRVNWQAGLGAEKVSAALEQLRLLHPARLVSNTPLPGIPARLWEALVLQAGVAPATRWSALSRGAQGSIARACGCTELQVTGKSLNKEEFVTCGGVRLGEVDFRTMQSRLCPGLHFAGELLDVDGMTGGFNFQAAWTTGWIAGRAVAGIVHEAS